MSVTNKLMELLDSSTKSDLDALNAEITSMEAKLASTRKMRDILNVRLNGVQPKRANEKKSKQGEAIQIGLYRRKAAKLLLARGLTLSEKLKEEINCPESIRETLLKHEWFFVSSSGAQLSAKGKSDFSE